jgi:WD40 repeat protein
VTDVAFSATARLMFASYEDAYCIAWETISKDGCVACDGMLLGVAALVVGGRLCRRVVLCAYLARRVCGATITAESFASSSSAAPRTFHELKGHRNRVSCIGVNSSGQALATGSWDTDVALWC